MGSFIAAGTPITKRITFNSGTLDFGSSRIVEIDNVALKVEWTMNPLYVLGSVKPQTYARSSQKVTLTGKIKSFAPEIMQAALGSSTPGTPNEIDTLDGQPTFVSPVGTFFDQSNKQYQYQFQNAMFKSYNMTAKMEDYAEWDFELEAMDIIIVNTN